MYCFVYRMGDVCADDFFEKTVLDGCLIIAGDKISNCFTILYDIDETKQNKQADYDDNDLLFFYCFLIFFSEFY